MQCAKQKKNNNSLPTLYPNQDSENGLRLRLVTLGFSGRLPKAHVKSYRLGDPESLCNSGGSAQPPRKPDPDSVQLIYLFAYGIPISLLFRYYVETIRSQKARATLIYPQNHLRACWLSGAVMIDSIKVEREMKISKHNNGSHKVGKFKNLQSLSVPETRTVKWYSSNTVSI